MQPVINPHSDIFSTQSGKPNGKKDARTAIRVWSERECGREICCVMTYRTAICSVESNSDGKHHAVSRFLSGGGIESVYLRCDGTEHFRRFHTIHKAVIEGERHV